MLKRKMYEKLLSWKQAEKRKVLLLFGARQTGKTFIVEEFARSEYKHFVKVDFRRDAEAARLLSAATSAEDLVSRLSLVAGGIADGSLVFFDEVQEFGKEVVTLSKYLLEDGRFDLVLSGSLLGTFIQGVESFPVGYAREERMCPLDFEEFCWAMSVPPAVISQLRHAYDSKEPLEESLHQALTALYRQYIVVGGMPEAVEAFVRNQRDLGAAQAVAAEIGNQYRRDITKYAGDQKTNIAAIYDNIPAQLAKENKRFAMKSVAENGRYPRLQDGFSWLMEAGVALPVYAVTEPKMPLMRTKEQRKFKLYASDCGMLAARYPQSASMDIVMGEGDGNYGAVFENVVAQELAAAGFNLYYYHHSRKGEVDFLLETKRGTVLPIEVKSGKDYKLHTALNNLLGTDGYGIECAYVLSEHNVSVGQRKEKPVYYLPLYMTMCLSEEADTRAPGTHLPEVVFN